MRGGQGEREGQEEGGRRREEVGQNRGGRKRAGGGVRKGAGGGRSGNPCPPQSIGFVYFHASVCLSSQPNFLGHHL